MNEKRIQEIETAIMKIIDSKPAGEASLIQEILGKLKSDRAVELTVNSIYPEKPVTTPFITPDMFIRVLAKLSLENKIGCGFNFKSGIKIEKTTKAHLADTA